MSGARCYPLLLGLLLSWGSLPAQAALAQSGGAYQQQGVMSFGPDKLEATDGPIPAAMRPLVAMPTLDGQGRPALRRGPAETADADVADVLAQRLSTDECRGDARLHDVVFANPREGWAVGDRGTIWHTADGGQHWALQSSGVACPLYSVSFVNAQVGWAAGGMALPLRPASTGVLLVTRDGGRHWNVVPKLVLPRLLQVRFVNERYGWAVGTPTPLYPSGVFYSDNSGQSWQPIPAGSQQRWLAGHLATPGHGTIVGALGMLGAVDRGTLDAARLPRLGLQGLTRVWTAAAPPAWLAGEGGTLLTSADGGRHWQPPAAGLPPEAADVDLLAMSVRGPKCWLAGAPGSLVFHSPDAGKTWSAQPTGQALPLHALTMLDDQNGVAVGELGTILATSDGGQTWRRQRGGGSRAALLGLFSQPGDIPFELIARAAANDGCLSVVDVLNRQDVETRPWHWADLPERIHEAVVATGGSGGHLAWQFPLRQSGLGLAEQQLIETWDNAHAGRGRAALEAYLVRQIRTWRPEIVVTADAGVDSESPACRLVGQVLAQALQSAADPQYQAERLGKLGLAPWQARRVLTAQAWGVRGAPELTTAQWAGRVGRALADVAAQGRQLLTERLQPPPATLAFHLSGDAVGDAQRQDLLAGLNLAPGGDARRPLSDAPADGVDTLARMAQRRRNAQAIIERADRDPRGGVELLAQTGDLLRGLDAGTAAALLLQLAQQYHDAGRWQAAAETYRLLLDRYPTHPLAAPAAVWLVQYYCSGEAACRARLLQQQAVQSASTWAGDESRPEQRAAHALEVGRHIEQLSPALAAEPALLFPLAVAQRQPGRNRPGDNALGSLSRGGRDAWWACADGERWLGEQKGPGPKPVVRCAKVADRPRLDGVLNDPCWQTAITTALRSPHGEDAAWPAEFKIAHDDEYLYLAITCQRAPEAHYAPAASGPRTRDADLSGEDRVQILLDIDRDYVTYYRLEVDHRGWTHDSCWGDPTWNPTWYVAAATEGQRWTAEIAIPLEQLAGRRLAAGETWALGVQRIVPATGFQSFSTPAAVKIIPEGFGYLMFE